MLWVLLSQCRALNHVLRLCLFDLRPYRDRPSFAHLPREPEDRREAAVSRWRLGRVWSHQVQRPNRCVCVYFGVCVCVLWLVHPCCFKRECGSSACVCVTAAPLEKYPLKKHKGLISFLLLFPLSRGGVSLYIPEPAAESVDSASTNETSRSCPKPRPCQLGLAGSWGCQSR